MEENEFAEGDEAIDESVVILWWFGDPVLRLDICIISWQETAYIIASLNLSSNKAATTLFPIGFIFLDNFHVI